MTQYIVTSTLPLGERFTDKGEAIQDAKTKTAKSKSKRFVLEIVGVSMLQELPIEFVPMPDPLKDADLEDDD